MANRPLPPAMAARWGHLPHLQYKCFSSGAHEWSSACPVCGVAGHDPSSGKPDRFFIRAATPEFDAHAKCRRCGHFEWLDEDEAEPSEAQIKKAEELRRRYEEREAKWRAAREEELVRAGWWKGYHHAMIEHGKRGYWTEAGIPPEFQDYWELGWVPQKRIRIGNETAEVPAFTIPYFRPGRVPYNIQYRLDTDRAGCGRYRFMWNMPKGLWLADPDTDPQGPLLLCEGVKKGGVAFVEMVARDSLGLSVAAVPDTSVNPDVLSGLDNCDPVYVCMDPDATEAAHKVARILGVDRTRVVSLPTKLDDLVVLYGATGRDLWHFVNKGKRSV